MAKQRKQVKKAPERKAPAKARLMSSAEIRLKNEQAKINAELRKLDKNLAKIRELAGGKLDKKIQEKGRKHKRQAKTAINEIANKITKLRTELTNKTLERQIVSKGAYKPKTNVKKADKLPEATKAKKGVRTIGSYTAWMRNDAIQDILENDVLYKVKVTSIAGESPKTDLDKVLNEIDAIFGIDSNDLLLAKIDLSTGAVFFEYKKGGYNPLDDDENEES